MARLPTPGQDNGNWGEILNDFLDQSHNNDGSIKESAIPKSTNVTTDGTSDIKVPSVKAVKDYTDVKVGEVNTQLAAIARHPIAKHRALMLYSHYSASGVYAAFPEDLFGGGMTAEYCGYDSFVAHADVWKTQFDMLVLHDLNGVSQLWASTPAQIKTAIEKFVTAGVFIVWFTGANFNVQKYGVNGVVDAAQTVSIQGLFPGLSRGQVAISSGVFQHGVNYPFGETEIIRTPCIPNYTWTPHYTSTDSETLFPVIAVKDAAIANCTAYKPGKFFVVGYAGSVAGNVDQSAGYKYILGSEICRIAMKKTVNARLAQDLIYGRKIVAIGVDCCNETANLDVMKHIIKAYSGKPVDIGLVSAHITDALASFYRSLAGQKLEVCTHTYDHFASANQVTVTDEIHTIDTTQIVRLHSPFRAVITYIKTTDDATTFTVNGSDIRTATPTAGQYAINAEATNTIDGYIKFNVADVGKEVKITYKHDNEYQINIGSIKSQENIGCLTRKAVFQTASGFSISPASYVLGKLEGYTFCAHTYFPSYDTLHNIAITNDKFPLRTGLIAKSAYNQSLTDVAVLQLGTKDYAKTTLIPAVAARCNQFEEPIQFYVHSFPFSETAAGSVWKSSTYNEDWKKTTISETRDYLEEFHTWMVSYFDSLGCFWLPRSGYTERYETINRDIDYAVFEDIHGTHVSACNNGKTVIKGLTFRVPVSSNTDVTCLTKSIASSYLSGVKYVWFDLGPGEKITFTV